MNIFCNDSGKILGVNPEPIYQNSAGVNIIRFIGQFPTSAQVLMAYKLPNGDWLPPKMLAFVQEVEVAKVDGGKFGVWEGRIGATPKIDEETGQVVKDENGQVLYDLDYTITQYSGTATIQFYVYAKNGPLATEAYTFNIEKGVPMEFPELGDTDDLKQLFTQILAVVTETRDNFNNLSISVSANTSDIGLLMDEQNNMRDKVDILEEEVETLKPSVSSNASDISNLITQQNDTSNAVEIIKSEIQGLRNDFKNEEHFRGWVTKNSEFETLKGDANDFAYSAESGTVWIYNNDAWQNSGEKVPGDGGSGVASNETPLMDGTASAGTYDAYARGDHRHPSDNNKLDKSTATTGYPQVYVKAGDGTQTMYNVSTDIVNGAIPRRTTNSDILVPSMPVSPYGAVNKMYVASNTVQNLKDGESANNVYQTFESTSFQVINPHVQYTGLTVPNGFKLQLPDYPEFNGVNSVILNGSGLVAGAHCFVAGGHNAALGQCNAVFGHDNITQGGSATAFGIMNYVNGDFAVAFGDQNRVEANRGFAAGYQNSIDSASIGGTVFGSNNLLMEWGSESFVSGHYNISKYPYQAVFGKYNDNKADTLFEVGRGSAGMRSNAFEVYKNGIAKIYGRPTAYEDVVNKGFVEDNFLTKKTGITQLNQAYVKTSAGNNELFGIDTNETANTIARRNASGMIYVNVPADESSAAFTNGTAVNKGYVNNKFVPKSTAVTSEQQVYIKNRDGSQDRLNILPTPTSGSSGIPNKGYVDNYFLTKPTSSGVVCFNATDGTTSIYPIYQSVPPTGGNAIPLCKPNGRLVVGTPVDGVEAVNLNYIAPVDCSIILGGTDSFVKRIPAYLKNEPESYVGACCVTHDVRHVIMGYDQDNAVFIVYNTADGTTIEYDDYTIE